MGAFGLAQSLGIEPKAARDYIERYFARYPGVRRFMDETRAQAAERGYVETLFGRRIHLVDIRGGSGPRRAAAERQAINAPMQGTASDLIKRAMLAVQDAIDTQGRATRIVMQVARRTGAGGARGRAGLGARRGARAHGRRGRAEGAAAGRGGRRAQLGRGALSGAAAPAPEPRVLGPKMAPFQNKPTTFGGQG